MGVTSPAADSPAMGGAVEIWPPQSYVQYLDVPADGHIAATHKALLQAPDGSRLRGFVKHFIRPGTHQGLLNEVLGCQILGAMGVPVPRCAVMPAPIPGAGQLAWAFISCEPSPVSHGTPNEIYQLADALQLEALADRLKQCALLPTMIAADQLIANGDRNTGNLVFTGKFGFVAIDHSNVLHGPGWKIEDTWFQQHPVASVPLKLFAMAQRPITADEANRLVAAAEVVQERFYQLQDALRQRTGAAESADVCAAMDMVWWRCRDLATWFRMHLRVI